MTLPAKKTVQLVDVRRLRPWDRNPRTITAERFESLKRSLVADPNHLRARPLIARTSGVVVAGNMRLRASQALLEEGNTKFVNEWPGGRIPCFVADLNDEQAIALALRDNNEYGEWNEQEVAELLYELEQRQSDLDLSGFTRERTTQLLDSVRGDKPAHRWPDDPAPPLPKRPKSKPGQIYELGDHRLMCGDCTKPDAVARLLEGTAPKLMVTDPPYGVELDLSWRADQATDRNREKGSASSGRRTKSAGPAGYTAKEIAGDTRADWSEAFELVPSIIVAYVWHASVFAADVQRGLERIGFTVAQEIVWDKINFALSRSDYQWQHEAALYAGKIGEGAEAIPWYGPSHARGVYAKKKGRPWLGDRTQTTVWQAPSPKRTSSPEEGYDHPTQKPSLLYQRPYMNHALRGDVVYEPFAGSGTALVAAEATGRRCYAMEIDPAFCDVVRLRYSEFVGEPELAP